VELRIWEEGPGARRAVRASVTDSGVGILRKDLPRVFDKFEQVESLETRTAGGAGLGLSLCKFVVEAHGGEIGVESRAGLGSRFHFSLPADRPASRG
jgi:signal transduction histidine kinase